MQFTWLKLRFLKENTVKNPSLSLVLQPASFPSPEKVNVGLG